MFVSTLFVILLLVPVLLNLIFLFLFVAAPVGVMFLSLSLLLLPTIISNIMFLLRLSDLLEVAIVTSCGSALKGLVSPIFLVAAEPSR